MTCGPSLVMRSCSSSFTCSVPFSPTETRLHANDHVLLHFAHVIAESGVVHVWEIQGRPFVGHPRTVGQHHVAVALVLIRDFRHGVCYVHE